MLSVLPPCHGCALALSGRTCLHPRPHRPLRAIAADLDGQVQAAQTVHQWHAQAAAGQRPGSCPGRLDLVEHERAALVDGLVTTPRHLLARLVSAGLVERGRREITSRGHRIRGYLIRAAQGAA